MSGNTKKTDQKASVGSEDEADRLVLDTLKEMNLLIPETPVEVQRAEEALSQTGIELPPALQDPFALLDARIGNKVIPLRVHHVNSETADLLARAAREGGQIAPDVEERMRQDRQRAEKEGNDDNKS